MSPRATSKLWWWIVSKALDLKRPIREADMTLQRPVGEVSRPTAVLSNGDLPRGITMRKQQPNAALAP